MRSSRPVVASVASVFTLVLIFTAAPSARAQSIWLDRTVPKSIHLELAKPMFSGPGDGFFTFGAYLTPRFPLGDNLSFVGELPFANLEDDFADESSASIGNPYVGIESNVKGEKGGWFEFGLRPPLADDEEFAVIAGIASDLNRWEAFFPNEFTVRAAGHWRMNPQAGGVGVDLRVAPAVWIPTGDNDGDTELFTTYGAQLLFRARDARGGVGLTGRWFMTAGEGADFGEETSHSLEAAFDFLSGDVRPGIVLRVPLDDDQILGLDVDSVVGVTVNCVLP